ncbi:MAG: hypothetical protein RJA63_2472 [Pseudomonadota bacterium]|jgi:uncharacterized protein YjbI with pentapeptide repeats|nr:pentapeptide repeat-containing protein [Uliginosibacterium sp.]
MTHAHHRLEFAGTDALGACFAKNGATFRECVFNSASLECGTLDGVFVDCHFRDIEWYWGLFNGALFAGCVFERCVFRGTSFQSCRFVECLFADCQFLPDNLDTPCTATRVRWYACRNQGSVGWASVCQPGQS